MKREDFLKKWPNAKINQCRTGKFSVNVCFKFYIEDNQYVESIELTGKDIPLPIDENIMEEILDIVDEDFDLKKQQFFHDFTITHCNIK